MKPKEYLQNLFFNSFLLKGVLFNGLIKLSDTLITLLVTIFLARYMGPDEFGKYIFALTLAILIFSPISGFNTYIIKQVSQYHEAKDWKLLKGFLLSSKLNVAIILLAISTIILLSLIVVPAKNFDSQNIFIYAIAVSSFLIMIGIPSSFLQGMKRVISAQIVLLLVRAIFLILILFFYFNIGNLASQEAMLLHLISLIFAFLMALFLLFNSLPKETLEVKAHFINKKWIKSSIPFLVISGLFVLNSHVDIVTIGFFLDDKFVGIYKAVLQLAFLVSFSLVIVNSVIPPQIARIYQLKNISELQTLVSKSTFIIFIMSLPVGFTFILFGDLFIELFFGLAYLDGKIALIFLCFGQIFNCLMGPVVTILNMTGNESDVVRGLVYSIILNIILNISLVPIYGIEGAAIGTFVSMCFWNIFLAIKVKNRVGILSSIRLN